MCNNVKKVDQEHKTPDTTVSSSKVTKKGGHSYSYECNNKYVTGLVLLVMAAALLIFSGILASGQFGAGKMDFIAGGLAIGSMALFGAAAYCLIPPPPKIDTDKLINAIEMK